MTQIKFEFNFGRPFPDNLSRYALIIHCGACMADRQKYFRRLLKAQEAGIPITNYGIFLAFAQKAKILKRTIRPFAKTKEF